MKLLQEEIIRFYLDANKIRENVLELLKNAGSGHLGGSYSEAEILAVLFNKFLKMDPSNVTLPCSKIGRSTPPPDIEDPREPQ